MPDAEAARDELDWVVRLISAVRSVRTEVHVAAGTPIPVRLRDAAPATLERADRWMEAIRRLARVSDLAPLDGDMPKGSAQAVLDEATLVLPLADLIDVVGRTGPAGARSATRRRRRCGRSQQKLANADFVRRAPEEVVEENRERLAAAEAEVARLEAALRWIE